MLDSEIKDYLDERKSLWLKKKIKNTTPADEKLAYEQRANELFSLAVWLPDAARRAGQLSMVSHPAKFSHPNAKTSNLIASCPRKADGFLRSGNVNAKLDVLGNAAALDVEKFLSLKLGDNKTILEHLEQDTETIHQQLAIDSLPFDEIRQGLLAIKKTDSQPKTHGGIKQIYFPIEPDEETYHLLSILMPSGILYELKKRINDMRFSDQAKTSREARKKNEIAEDYSEIYNLTSIGFGGTKPQNISVLNNQNGGVAYLLPASPPVLGGRKINPPRKSFFDSSYTKPVYYQDLFEDFHKILSSAINNKATRNKVKRLAKAIFFAVIDRSWEIRYLEPGWSDSDRYVQLPKSEKLWLDQQYRQSEDKNEEWINTIESRFIRWFNHAYDQALKDKAYPLSDYEFIELTSWLEECGEGWK